MEFFKIYLKKKLKYNHKINQSAFGASLNLKTKLTIMSLVKSTKENRVNTSQI